jgi:hypothetical protein
VLGPLRVATPDRPIPIRSAKRQLLLARLALDPGEAVRREDLAALLWPDGEPRDLARVLATHIGRRRSLTEPGRAHYIGRISRLRVLVSPLALGGRGASTRPGWGHAKHGPPAAPANAARRAARTTCTRNGAGNSPRAAPGRLRNEKVGGSNPPSSTDGNPA